MPQEDKENNLNSCKGSQRYNGTIYPKESQESTIYVERIMLSIAR